MPTFGDPATPDTLPGSPERVALVGFMGSGKSTVGRLLADHLGWVFVDLDTAVEELAGATVAEVFRRQGEPAFRRLETSALTSALNRPGVVLALGGGTLEHPANQQMLATAPRTVVVYLSAPFATLLARCQAQAEDPAAAVRPILADLAAAEQRFNRRLAFYQAAAHAVIDNSAQTAPETLAAIVAALQSGSFAAGG